MKKIQITHEEVKEEELLILKKTLKVLGDNNIKYYIFAGTFLGAVRHKGFIPWDDDIDIIIERTEYNRLVEILKNKGCIINNKLKAVGYELGNADWPFIKIVNESIKLNSNDGCDENLWIDLFPFDGVPKFNSKKYYKKLLKKQKLFMRLRYCKRKQIRADENQIRRFIKKILFLPLKLIPYNIYIRNYIYYCSKYDIKDCEYVCNNVWGIGERGKILKNKLAVSKYEFENISVNGFKDYDYVLSTLYGDYMTLPPVNERMAHKFTAWKDVECESENKK